MGNKLKNVYKESFSVFHDYNFENDDEIWRKTIIRFTSNRPVETEEDFARSKLNGSK